MSPQSRVTLESWHVEATEMAEERLLSQLRGGDQDALIPLLQELLRSPRDRANASKVAQRIWSYVSHFVGATKLGNAFNDVGGAAYRKFDENELYDRPELFKVMTKAYDGKDNCLQLKDKWVELLVQAFSEGNVTLEEVQNGLEEIRSQGVREWANAVRDLHEFTKANRSVYNYTFEEIDGMDTIHSGHTDNLKYEEPGLKVWLSRLTAAEGMPYDHQVTVEVYDADTGGWRTAIEYEAK